MDYNWPSVNRISRFRGRARRGNATTVGLSLIALLGCTALVVDVGFLLSARTDLQASLDAAALAGVGYFDGTAAGVDLAIAKAVEFAALNEIIGEGVTLPATAVTAGRIGDDGVFVASNVPAEINALSIAHSEVDIPTFFAGVAFSRSTMSMRASSVARRFPSRGAGRVECFLPLGVPDCVLNNPAAFEGLELRLNSANQDNAGWADPDGNPTANSVRDALTGQCERGEASAGEDVFLNNGTINTALSTLADVLNNTTDAETGPWDTARWGAIPAQMAGSTVNPPNYGQSVLQGPIVLFESDPNTPCAANVQFNQSKKITGFSWAILYDVDSHGSGKNIRVKLDLTHEYDVGTTGGGLPTNVVAPGNGSLVR